MLTQTDSKEDVEGTDTADTTLATLVQWVEDAEEEGEPMRQRSERDRDYYDGLQVTNEEAVELRKRNQPVIAFNLIKGKVDYLLGLEKNQRSDPKAYPRNPDDEDAAKAATDSIRYVCDINSFPMVASGVWENMVVEGAGGVDVCAEQTARGEIEIKVTRVHWDRMIWDPYSRERDYSDAKFLGTILWMDEADLLARWPDAGPVLDFAYAAVSNTSAWDDRPRWSIWADQKRRRVRVVQMYWRTGDDWKFGTFTRGGWLDEAAPSYYLDEYGQPECPLIFASSYINRDNHRYGPVRDLIDPQDEINLRHRKAVHLLSVRQVVAEEGAVRDVDAARREMAKPDGYIEIAPGMKFDVQTTQDLSTGQAQLLQEAKAVFQTMGPNAALLGKQGSASGRAIALSQQGGQVEAGALMDIHRDWRRRVYRAIWNRIKQYWTAEKWVRVTDNEHNIRFVALNRQTMALDPMTGQPVPQVENDVSQMFVDVVVEEGQDIATLQIEEFQTMAELAKAGLPIPPDLLIEASNLRNKQKILERLREAQQGGPQGPPPELIAAQMEQQRAQMDAELRAGEIASRAELEREKMTRQAEADRLKIEAEDRRKAAELEMQYQIALLDQQAKAADREAQAVMDRERMAVEDRRAGEAAMREQQTAATKPDQGAELARALQDMLTPVMGRLEEVAAQVSAPREIVRGPDGRAMGVRVGNTVRQIARGPDGRATGVL